MANWTGPNPNRMLPGEPWSSDLALAAFEDPVAIAEGAPGAPRVWGSALQFNLLASATITPGSQAFSITDLEPHLGVMVWTDADIDGDVTNRVTIEVSGNNGSSWTVIQPNAARGSVMVLSLGSGANTSRFTFNRDGVERGGGGLLVNAVRIEVLNPGSSEYTFQGGTLKVYGFWRGWE